MNGSVFGSTCLYKGLGVSGLEGSEKNNIVIVMYLVNYWTYSSFRSSCCCCCFLGHDHLYDTSVVFVRTVFHNYVHITLLSLKCQS